MRKGGIRIFFTIPNIFTLLNLAFGFVGFFVAIMGDLLLAFIFVVLAIVSDGLDGFVARKLGAVSDLGRELDSLCDEVSFGVTPAAMFVISVSDSGLLPIALVVAIIYAGFGALRLARFNIYGSKEFFEGLAIPAAAFFSCLVTLCIVQISVVLATIMQLVIAILMISTVSFPSTKTRIGIKAIALTIVIGTVLFFMLTLTYLRGLTPEKLVLWYLLMIMLSYVSTSAPIFDRMLRKTIDAKRPEL